MTLKQSSKILPNLALLLVVILVSLLAAEGAVRLKGFKPWIVKPEKILIEPGGRLVERDEQLGYTLLPGKFKALYSSGYSCQMTHSKDGTRITHVPSPNNSLPRKKEIWIFGCSFTYGWSLNDNQTFPWLLQKKFPDYEIVNFAVPGYATLQSLTQFEKALKTQPVPRIAVYVYASFHDERNTFLRKRLKSVGSANRIGSYWQPYARFQKDGSLRYGMNDLAYRPAVPLTKYSALANFVDERINNLEDRVVHSREISKILIQRFASEAKEHDVDFLLAGIDGDSAPLLQTLAKEGINTVDISVDLTGRNHRNWPHDSHPNAATNLKYSEKLGAWFVSRIENPKPNKTEELQSKIT